MSFIQFYGKLSVKNPASRGQVNLDIFNYGRGFEVCQAVGGTNLRENGNWFFVRETAGELLQKFPRTPSKLFEFG